MTNKSYIIAMVGMIIVLLAIGGVYAGSGLDTSFTYLGYLEDDGKPIDGACDFDFSLHNAPTGGLISDPAPLANVTVDRGVFYVILDFGNQFNGQDRWLETMIRCPAGSGAYTTLSPRVLLKYPLEGSLPGVYPDGTGQVGINKTSPAQTLDVNGVVAATGGNSTNWNTAYGWGNHAAQGYLTSETDPQVGSIITNRIPKWTGSSLNNSQITDTGTNVGINNTSPSYRMDVNGNLRTTGFIYYTLSNSTKILLGSGSSAGVMEMRGANGNLNVLASYVSGLSNNGWVAVYDSAGSQQAGMYVDGSGQGRVWGDIVGFNLKNPQEVGTEIGYSYLGGPEAATYVRGTAQLVDGQAIITLPDHFLAVASPKDITVQLTPLSAQSQGLAIVDKSLNGMVVQELNSGTGTYEFDFFVTAIRKGYEDYEVIRPAFVPQPGLAELDESAVRNNDSDASPNP